MGVFVEGRAVAMTRPETPPVMACGVVERAHQETREILIGRIPALPYAGLWTFPGGPVERGEAPEAALRRAMESLLGLAVDVRTGQPPFDLMWDGVLLRWRYFFCQSASEIRNSHFEELRWVLPGSLREYEFEPAAQQVVDWLLEAEAGADD